jgi:hypothetical protein
MNTLVIYDNTGKIYYQANGNVQDPIGLKFIKVEIPEGKRITSVDTSKTPNVPVFEDIPIDLIQELYQKLTAIQTELSSKLESNTELNLMVLEAMAQTYETVLPFLP